MMLPPGEINVMVPKLRVTLQGVRISFAILKIVFAIFYFYCFLNAVCSLTSGGFRIVSDTLVYKRLGFDGFYRATQYTSVCPSVCTSV